MANRGSLIEKGIVREVDRSAPDGLSLLERAVNINSGTMNLEGVREVGRLFAPEFESLGFTTRWVDGADWKRAGHLIAERPGRQGALGVLLIGHLDTVFEKDSPFQSFTRLSDSTAAGPGICDMKGGDVVMLLALRALREAGLLDELRVTAVLMGDEEHCGSPRDLARRDLIAAARNSEVALGFENGDGDPRTAVVGRRGFTGWTLRTSGRPFHSSQIFREDVGSGAIYEAARILAAFHDSLAGDPLLTFNPGLIVGGTRISLDAEQSRGTAFGKSNVVAESTAVVGDLRAVSPDESERAQETMRRLVAAHYPHTGAEIQFDQEYPPFPPTEGNLRLLAHFDRVSRDLGFGPVAAEDPAKAGAADISFTSGIVPMGLDGLGLKGSAGHTLDETADLRTLPMQAKRVAVLLARLAAGS